MTSERSTSPWVYAGCGCAGCVGLCVLILAAATFFGVSTFQGFVEDIGDPAAQAEKARELLGTERLPEGYHARIVLRAPFRLFDAAILTDGPEIVAGEDLDDFSPLDSEHLGAHAFIYLAVRRGAVDGDPDSVFDGRRRSGGTHVDLGSDFESRQELSRGRFELDPGQVEYAAHRGELRTEDGHRVDGVYSQMQIGCPGDGRLRFAVWFERAAGDADAALDLAGTPADEEALRDFMSHFNLCMR